MVKFGTAGLDNNFAQMGFKKTIEAPLYLEKMGLDAFEYQCGRGVRISEKSASEFGAACREKNITLSLHAPYYISMSSLEEEKRLNSINYILDSAKAVEFDVRFFGKGVCFSLRGGAFRGDPSCGFSDLLAVHVIATVCRETVCAATLNDSGINFSVCHYKSFL